MSWLKNVTQWVVIALLAVVAFLAAALRVRGSQLHKAKVSLLKAEMDAETKESDQRVADARQAYEKALKEWEKLQ